MRLTAAAHWKRYQFRKKCGIGTLFVNPRNFLRLIGSLELVKPCSPVTGSLWTLSQPVTGLLLLSLRDLKSVSISQPQKTEELRVRSPSVYTLLKRVYSLFFYAFTQRSYSSSSFLLMANGVTAPAVPRNSSIIMSPALKSSPVAGEPPEGVVLPGVEGSCFGFGVLLPAGV